MPYYETLGNREVHGKQVLSAFDVITRENSTWNKFDFLIMMEKNLVSDLL